MTKPVVGAPSAIGLRITCPLPWWGSIPPIPSAHWADPPLAWLWVACLKCLPHCLPGDRFLCPLHSQFVLLHCFVPSHSGSCYLTHHLDNMVLEGRCLVMNTCGPWWCISIRTQRVLCERGEVDLRNGEGWGGLWKESQSWDGLHWGSWAFCVQSFSDVSRGGGAPVCFRFIANWSILFVSKSGGEKRWGLQEEQGDGCGDWEPGRLLWRLCLLLRVMLVGSFFKLEIFYIIWKYVFFKN